MHRIAPVLLIMAAFWLCSPQACPADIQLSDILQDSRQLIIKKSTYKHVYRYPQDKFDSQPQLILTVSKFQWKNYAQISYEISSAISEETGAMLIKFQENGMEWRTLRVDFWLFSREDLLADVLVFQEPTHIETRKTIVLESPLQGQKNNSYKGNVLFTSILSMTAQSSSASFEVKITSEIESSTQFSISLKTGANTTIKRIKISYLLYETSEVSAQSHYYGVAETRFNNWHLVRQPLVGLNIFPARYMLLGLVNLEVMGDTEQPLSFSMFLSQEPTDVLSFISSSSALDLVAVQYLLLGRSMVMTCVKCDQSYISYDQQSKQVSCVAKEQCPEISYSENAHMQFSCRKCSADENMATVDGGDGRKYCECKEGFTVDTQTGRCRQQTPSNAVKGCPDPYEIRNSFMICQCRQGFVRDEFGMCAGTCTVRNSYWDPESSACKCFLGHEYQVSTASCQAVHSECPTNQVMLQGNCECSPNTFWQQSSQGCVMCPEGTFRTGSSQLCQSCPAQCSECITAKLCVACKEGYEFDNFKCTNESEGGFEIRTIGFEISTRDKQQQREAKQPGEITQTTEKKESVVPVVSPNEDSKPIFNNPSQTNETFVFKASHKSPIYVGPGIVLRLLIRPSTKKTQEQVNSMFTISIEDSQNLPSSIYFSQNPQNFEQLRCFLDYHNQLPVADFTIQVAARLTPQVQKNLSIHSSSASQAISSALGFDKGDSFLQ